MVDNQLIGKNVVVFKDDGYKKFGKLISIQDGLVLLEFRDGRQEYIPMLKVSTIQLDTKVGA